MAELEKSDSPTGSNGSFIRGSDLALRERELLTMLRAPVFQISDYFMGVASETLGRQVDFLLADQRGVRTQRGEFTKEYESLVSKGAAYILMNQIVFYTLLSYITKWQKFEHLNKPTDLQTYFDSVNLDKKYDVIFRPRIAPMLPLESIDSLNRIIEMISGLCRELTERNLIGKILPELIPTDLRKKTAAYYTSNAAADLMSTLTIEREGSIVLDPACGSGTLLISAYRRKEELVLVDDETDHGKLLQEIFGVEVSLFAASLAALQLSVLSGNVISSPKILVGDAFSLLGQSQLSASLPEMGQESKEGVIIPKADTILMNPPFTRYNRLDKSYRKGLERILLHKRKYFGRQMNLQCYFLLLVDDLLRNRGRLAAVLPASTFYASYASGIRKMLTEKYWIEYIIFSNVQETFSEQCSFKEVLFVAKKNHDEVADTKVVVLKVPLTLDNLPNLLGKLRSASADFENSEMRIRIVKKAQFESERNWLIFGQSREIADLMSRIYTSAGQKLTEGRQILVSLRRGFETYGPEVFFIPNKDWRILQENENEILVERKNSFRDRLSIPRHFLIRAMRKPKLYIDRITPDIHHYVLSIPASHVHDLPEGVKDYVKWGEKQRISALEWEKGRKVRWYSFVQKQIVRHGAAGRLLFLRKFRISTTSILAHYFENEITASKGYYALSTGDKDSDLALAAWFNSTIFIADFLRIRRPIEGAYSELMIEDIRKMRCLNARKIKTDKLKAIQEKFREMSHMKLPPIPQQIGQVYRRELDEAVLAAFDIRDTETLVERLYEDVISQTRPKSNTLTKARCRNAEAKQIYSKQEKS